VNFAKLSPHFCLTFKIHVKHLVLHCQFIYLQHEGNLADYRFKHEFDNANSPYHRGLMIRQASNQSSNYTQSKALLYACLPDSHYTVLLTLQTDKQTSIVVLILANNNQNQEYDYHQLVGDCKFCT